MAVGNTSPHGLKKYGSPLDPIPGRVGHNEMIDILNLIPGLGIGPLSSRPVPASGLRFWLEESTSRLSVNMGTAWADIAPIGGTTPTNLAINGTANEGVSARAARGDHTHPLPLASKTAHGAMSSGDKRWLDTLISIGLWGIDNDQIATPHPNFSTPSNDPLRLTHGNKVLQFAGRVTCQTAGRVFMEFNGSNNYWPSWVSESTSAFEIITYASGTYGKIWAKITNGSSLELISNPAQVGTTYIFDNVRILRRP